MINIRKTNVIFVKKSKTKSNLVPKWTLKVFFLSFCAAAPHFHNSLHKTLTTFSASEWDSVWSHLKASLGKSSQSLLLAALQQPWGHARISLSLSSAENLGKCSAHCISPESNSRKKGDWRYCYGVHIPTPWHHHLDSSLCIQIHSAALTMVGTDTILGILGEKKITETFSFKHTAVSETSRWVVGLFWTSHWTDLKSLE